MTSTLPVFRQTLGQEGYYPSHTERMNVRLQRAISQQLRETGGIMWYADFLEPLVAHLKDLHQAGKLFKGSYRYRASTLFRDIQEHGSERYKMALQEDNPGKSLEEIAEKLARENVQHAATDRAIYLLLGVKNDAPGFSVSPVYTLLCKAFGLDQPYDTLQFTSDPQVPWSKIMELGDTLSQKTLFRPSNHGAKTFRQLIEDRLTRKGASHILNDLQDLEKLDISSIKDEDHKQWFYDATVGAYHHLFGHLVPVAYTSPRHAKEFLADFMNLNPVKGKNLIFRVN